MSKIAVNATGFDQFYPEKIEQDPENWLNESGKAFIGKLVRRFRGRKKRTSSMISLINRESELLPSKSEHQLQDIALELRLQLRRDGFLNAHVAQAFALVREIAHRKVGMRHFDEQLMGGWILLNGMVAEMQTGEGKTLTATLPACTAAMAGIPVHVITVNDYLVERDSDIMRPIYEALGLTVAGVTAEMDHAQRQAAYRCDIVYCSNKTIVFDYLRDQILLGKNSSDVQLQIEKIYDGGARAQQLLLRGLCFAIVDEADSVLVDEARTPLIISAEVSTADEEKVASEAIEIAQTLILGEAFEIDLSARKVILLESGYHKVDALCTSYGGVWTGPIRRDELVRQAITALYLFKLDEHYIVRDNKIQVIDEFTGRILEDRSWSEGLHQLIEVKEGCELTKRKEPLAKISYQRFFRRYLNLSGMTGTAVEVTSELSSIYELGVVEIPTHLASRRVLHIDKIFETESEKWEYIASRVEQLFNEGSPVLLGTRSVAASEKASSYLDLRGVPHRVLNARQDKAEAEIIAGAGQVAQVTIATNMAGRGTDIHIAEAACITGGLHVVLTERHHSQRIDRQLAGRCARQGDPGSFEAVLSMEDALIKEMGTSFTKWLFRIFKGSPPKLRGQIGRLLFCVTQKKVVASQSRVRRQLFKSDRQIGDILSFSGRSE
jgi:preprotein translocase subunit SecA